MVACCFCPFMFLTVLSDYLGACGVCACVVGVVGGRWCVCGGVRKIVCRVQLVPVLLLGTR